ncbi:uncharacterized protein LOC132397246 [Hypanus sabinus]|uniref:uncharacterized protein LOC132397246 n=1 Tax=Hypanus sabinus TaxID=79690 RepID=UPI0028C46879|nr:uncharacterized protein LOC132397246 [Hypanus sabinus]XP_059831709.1 uncharacterized protein LOC132397246 [Hypanus sabinus]
MSISIIDFGSFALGKAEPSDNEMKRLSTEFMRELNKNGFVYLKNTGIKEEQVFRTMDISTKFFLLPKKTKQQYAISNDSDIPHHGWYDLETERLNKEDNIELKEAFNLSALTSNDKWPIKEAPEFSNSMETFFRTCQELSTRILKVLELSLGMETDFFVSKHLKMGTITNSTTLRTLNYPPIQKSSLEAYQTRCGEHSDFGTFTLLFQDKNGGLEVKSRSGQYITAPYIPNTVLFNVANILQRWTSDRWISTKHRVPIPQTEDAMNRTRQSLAFFVHPSHDAIIACCDGLDKYPPISSIQYLKDNHSNFFSKESYPTIV